MINGSGSFIGTGLNYQHILISTKKHIYGFYPHQLSLHT